MKNFEDELDRIRIELYEKTKGLEKMDIINDVNSHAKKIAYDFGIKIKKSEEIFQIISV